MTVIQIVGVIAATVVLVMICRSPDAKANFKEEHKALIIAIGPMVAFLVLVYIVLAQVG